MGARAADADSSVPVQLYHCRHNAARSKVAYLQRRPHPGYRSESAARGWINTFSVVNPHLQNPYTMHYTLGFQHEIAPNLALETAFVGTRGVKFLMQRWMNEPDRRTGPRPNPQLNTNYYLDESQQMSYVSWQSSFRRAILTWTQR